MCPSYARHLTINLNGGDSPFGFEIDVAVYLPLHSPKTTPSATAALGNATPVTSALKLCNSFFGFVTGKRGFPSIVVTVASATHSIHCAATSDFFVVTNFSFFRRGDLDNVIISSLCIIGSTMRILVGGELISRVSMLLVSDG